MKKVSNYIIFTLITFMFVLIIPKADSCTYKEQAALNKEASNIKFNYEIVDKTDEINDGLEEKEYYINDYYYIQLSIANLNENMYVEVKNDKNDNIMTFHNTDAVDGIITFKKESNQVVKYTFNIYASTETCTSKLQTKYVTAPKFNNFYKSGVCNDIPDYKYCQELITTNMADEKLATYIGKYFRQKVAKSNEISEKKVDFWKYAIYFLIVLGILGLIFFGVFVFRKIREKRRGI